MSQEINPDVSAMETLPVPVQPMPSDYERKALREIELWKEPNTGWFGQAAARFNQAVHGLTDLVRKVPGVDWTIDNVVTGLLELTNEIVQDSVWTEAVYRDFERIGVSIEGTEDIARLDLAEVDRALDGLDMKYRTLAAAEGAATGFAGAAGIAPDVVALVAMNLRAAGEYAAYCGFDIGRPEERLYALHILNAVSAPSNAAQEVALTPLIRISQRVARDQVIQAMEQHALTRALQNAARGLGVRLTRAKLAQVVPVAGAVVGSGFNAYYTSKVCDAAFFLYRERFLMRKYGPVLVENEA